MVDGCILSVGSPDVIVEVSDVFPAPAEGSANHGSWFAVISVPPPAPYDTDVVSNVPANPLCAGGKDVPAAILGTARVGGRTPGNGSGQCRGDATPTLLNTPNGVFFNVDVTLESPAVTGYNQTGPVGTLIAGFQIVYASGTEPTSSNYFTGAWTPALDPANTAMAKGVIPVGTATTQVALPQGAPGTNYWLATRIVYADTSLNTNLNACTVGTDCPVVVSDVSAHCGPVSYGLPCLQVDLTPSTKDDGIPAASSLLPGEPIVYTIRLVNQGSCSGVAWVRIQAKVKKEGALTVSAMYSTRLAWTRPTSMSPRSTLRRGRR